MADAHPSLDEIEKGLLEACPRCQYLLRGLPTGHTCPECGLAFDRRWRVFGGKTARYTYQRIGRIVAVVLVSVYLLVALTSAALARQFGGVASACGCLLVVFWIARKMRFGIGFVAVGPEGIAFYHGSGQPERYPWDRVGKARYDLVRRAPIIIIDQAPVSLNMRIFFSGDVCETERCVRYINSASFPAPSGAADSSPGRSPGSTTGSDTEEPRRGD
jgi:hypothetical protein